MKNIKLLIVLMIAFSSVNTLKSQVIHPTKVTKAVHFDVSKELRTIDEVPYGVRKRTWKNRLVPNKFDIDDELKRMPILDGPDAVLQSEIMNGGRSQGTVHENFTGVVNTYSVAPPDTDGDVGHDHYFQMVNNGFAIWDKSGNLLYGPVDNITLWHGFNGPWSNTNDGDPIVVYDEYANRWVATQFALPFDNGPYYELIAVSQTSDPLGAWNRYAFEFENMPDYPKFAVWPDGYYFSTHQFANAQSWAGAGMSICDREAMIAGDPDAEMIYFSMGYDSYGLLPADADGALPPPPGSPNYVLDVASNSLRLWEVDIDWENTSNSTVTTLPSLPTAPFSTQGISISQPETDQQLASMTGMTMYRLQYRNFDDYQVMMATHTVNSGNGRAGIRWYELRNYGVGWDIYQQGTYAPQDGENRWMGSISMNQYGDIAIGYSVASASTYPSIRIAGQSAGAPLGLGIMDIDETSIYEGSASQTGVNRWGDYAAMAVDPTDGETFWFTTEYSNGGWNWATQIASFGFVQIPTTDFTSDEILIPVGETINYTDLTSGLPNNWQWTFEGGNPSSSTEQNPGNILYETEGTFSVKLVSSNSLGIDSVYRETYVTTSTTVLPEVDFTYEIRSLCLGDTISFIDQTLLSPIQWNWQFEPSDIDFINGTDENSQNPEVVFNSTSDYSVSLTSWNLNGSSEITKTDLIKLGGLHPYFFETFENNGFENNNWTVINKDKKVTWEIYEIGGTQPGTHAPAVNFREYYAIGQRDRLITPLINLEGMSSASLEFQHSYAQHTEMITVTDSLIVLISDDCGNTWTRLMSAGEDGSGNFATHEPTSYDFSPEVASDWCMEGWGAPCNALDISQWAGSPNIKIAFETFSFYGNPIFIDNVIISQFVGTDENIDASTKIRIYPNPTSGSFTIVIPKEKIYSNVLITNQLGQTVYNDNISDNTSRLVINESTDWKSGVYFIKLMGNSGTVTKKIILE
ncbi:MAG: T9SS type A sorting domain-containing protein [Bacteroidota bacterium]